MAGEPITLANFYRIRWGHHDEWIELFERNHWPVLQAQIASGRLLGVRSYTPRFHGDGRADWDFLVTITYRDWAALQEHSDQEIVRRLYPDQGRFVQEERLRFELLDAHWDVPIIEHALPAARA